MKSCLRSTCRDAGNGDVTPAPHAQRPRVHRVLGGVGPHRKAAGGRRDLLATIGIASADRQIADRHYVEATATLLEVLRDHGTPPVAMAVLGRLDNALRKQEDVARLAAVYGEVFNA